jgi:integrase
VESHSWSTVKIDRNGLQFFWKHVLERDWQWVNIVKAPKVRSLPDILTTTEVEQLIGATRNLRYRVFLLATYSMGLRLSETLALQESTEISSGPLIIDTLASTASNGSNAITKWLITHLTAVYHSCCRAIISEPIRDCFSVTFFPTVSMCRRPAAIRSPLSTTVKSQTIYSWVLKCLIGEYCLRAYQTHKGNYKRNYNGIDSCMNFIEFHKSSYTGRFDAPYAINKLVFNHRLHAPNVELRSAALFAASLSSASLACVTLNRRLWC